MTRQPVTEAVGALTPPTDAQKSEARQTGGDLSAHARYMADWPALNTLEHVAPPAPLPLPDSFTVAAWNIERCKRVEESATLLRATGADIVLATEMDHGMARSAQRHTTRDLAGLLGMGYIYGVEFVELGTGDPYETPVFKDIPNQASFHGNAILSRYPLEHPALIPLDDGGAWYVQSEKIGDQFRVGGRMAMAAQIGGITFASAHYESASTADDRATQTERMIQTLNSLYGTGPTVIGGDLNTIGFANAHRSTAEILSTPDRDEPSFTHFAAHGFDWRSSTTGAVTTRAHPIGPPRYPLATLDWIVTRNASAHAPAVHAAVSDRGDYLSDHELLTCRITRPA